MSPVPLAPSKKQRVTDDKVIDKLSLEKPKKTTTLGKKAREQHIPRTDASEAVGDVDTDAPHKFTLCGHVWSASTTTDKINLFNDKTSNNTKRPFQN